MSWFSILSNISTTKAPGSVPKNVPCKRKIRSTTGSLLSAHFGGESSDVGIAFSISNEFAYLVKEQKKKKKTQITPIYLKGAIN